MTQDFLPDLEPAELGLTLAGTPLPDFAEPICAPHGTTPPRRPGSVRRTMSIDVHWPEGFARPGHYLGRCRDARTDDPAQRPDLLAEAELRAVIADRTILSITAEPSPAGLPALVGARAGGHLRQALVEALPQEKAQGTPLHLLIDDLAGASFVSGWAYTRWHDDWANLFADLPKPQMTGVCMGLRRGSPGLDEDGTAVPSDNVPRVEPLPNPADPHGWHALPDWPGMAFRRARRIDVWREGDAIAVEALFQDSATAPDGGARLAIHEYLLHARIGPDGRLARLEATPGTLPYAVCRAAPANTVALLGVPARDLREEVLARLRRTAGCTHLNDALRALAEVEVLAAALPGPD